MTKTKANANEWTAKVLALLKLGNTTAAIAQIKVAPSVKDLNALHTALAAPAFAGRWPEVRAVIDHSLQALSAPRLHRSP